jgi:NAD(P)-dependent dehydrogenase (short-subunit alcohol dehydrogenase family)
MASAGDWDYGFTLLEWEACMKVLGMVKDDPNQVPDLELMKGLISKVYKNARKERRKETEIQRLQEDLSTKQQTYIFHYQTGKPEEFSAPDDESLLLNKSTGCYACGTRFHEIHPFYHRLCPDCATIQLSKREQRSDLTGRVAVVTGGRIKVGFATALKLLRDGATVVVTTRFPNDALMAFSEEPDFDDWKERLILYGLDLRNLKSIDAFVDYLFAHFDALDILVNNAAQTIKYDTAYYSQLLKREQESSKLLTAESNRIKKAGELSEADALALLPGASSEVITKTDIFNQPLDERAHNSWTATLSEVSTVELLEVNVINNIAPFMLNSRLKPLMEKSSFPTRFIINVTSSEGQFSYSRKTIFHPHTNMTKAALNMMTRTSAEDFARSAILMNSVDVGWVSTGNPIEKKERLAEQGHVMPLDIHDAASRIFDPIAMALNSEVNLWGKLFKNYKVVDW